MVMLMTLTPIGLSVDCIRRMGYIHRPAYDEQH